MLQVSHSTTGHSTMKSMKRYIHNAYLTILGISIVTALGCYGNNPVVPGIETPPGGNSPHKDETGYTRQVTFKITETTIETSNFDSKTFVEVNARLVLTVDGIDQEQVLLNYSLENYLIWNPKLADRAQAEEVYGEISKVIPVMKDVNQE